MDKEVLKAIHSISPEQTFVDNASLKADPYRRLLEKLRAPKNIPVGLENYRARRMKRLEAQIAFIDGLSNSKKTHKAEALLASIKSFIPEKRIKEFSTLSAGLETPKPDPNIDTQLFDLFNELIEPDAEDEFHRSIRKMNVNYSCDFADEGDENLDDTLPATPTQ